MPTTSSTRPYRQQAPAAKQVPLGRPDGDYPRLSPVSAGEVITACDINDLIEKVNGLCAAVDYLQELVVAVMQSTKDKRKAAVKVLAEGMEPSWGRDRVELVLKPYLERDGLTINDLLGP